MKVIFILLASLFVVSCDTDTASRDQANRAPRVQISQNSDRFEVVRVQVIKDDLAYGNERGVYILKDKQTGVEYLGVSGIGISELGSHQSGKVRVSDEKY